MKNFFVFWIIIVVFCCMGWQVKSQENIALAQRVYVDDWQRTVLIPRQPQRILSLTTSYDTVLLSLVEPQRLAGVNFLTRYERYSPEWKQAKKVKTVLFSYPLEKIIQLKPDLVIAPEFTDRSIINGIEGMGIPVIVVENPKTVDKVKTLLLHLADAVGEKYKGERYVNKIEKQLRQIENIRTRIPAAEQKTMLFLSSMEGYAGQGSLMDDMATYMGIKNGPTVKGYPVRTAFTDERILQMDPDFIFVPVYKTSDQAWKQRYLYNPALQSVKAVQAGNVMPVTAAYLYTGNQHIGESMLAIMRIVYPQYMSEAEEHVK